MLRWPTQPLVRLRLMKRFGLCVLLCILIPPLVLADFQGEVVRVLDGDTLEVLHNDRPERIRVSGIDCPEKGQAYGRRAKQAASEVGTRPLSRCVSSFPPSDWSPALRIMPPGVTTEAGFHQHGSCLGGIPFMAFHTLTPSLQQLQRLPDSPANVVRILLAPHPVRVEHRRE